MAAEIGSRVHALLGTDPQRTKLISILASLDAGDVLSIDEIHALSTETQETLYTAMEGLYVDAIVSDSQTRTVRIRLNPFTLVGATTKEGALSAPFRSRFRQVLTLDPYSPEDIAEIVRRKAKRLGAEILEGTSDAIAARSRGIPREAIRLLECARDLAAIPNASAISPLHVAGSANLLGIDELGVTKEERRIIDLLLRRRRPMGLESICNTLGLSKETYRSIHEPHLLASGLLTLTERGRKVTRKAREVYGERSEARTAGRPVASPRMPSPRSA
jgi:Holliday junction DNA helicase RuvB